MKKFLPVALLLGLIAACCSPAYINILPTDVTYLAADGSVPTDRVSFDQGWSDAQRELFWFTPQGAHIMPYRWFAEIEQPDNQELFRNTKHMSMLGYLPVDSSRTNPAGLPIGFAMSRATSEEGAWMGFTCAACHVNQIDYRGNKMLIDGAPTLGNFVGFFDRVVASLNNTYADQDKFNRFAERVIGKEKMTEEAVDALRSKLAEVAKGATERQKVNALPDHFPEDFTSYGRLDAFTNIENAGTAFGLGNLSNKNFPIAPVSYPFLWGTHQSNVVQWNGSAPNEPRLVGPMVRNVGQVVGVFGGLEIKKSRSPFKRADYSSTVDFEGLGELEGLVKILRAPSWVDPASKLPALDMEKVAAGGILYAKHCASCHEVVKPENQYDNYKAVMTPVAGLLNTDPMTAWAAEHHVASTEFLKGSKAKIVADSRFGDSTQAINIPVNGVVGLALKHPRKIINGILITEGVKADDDWEAIMEDYVQNRDSILEERVDDHDFDGVVMTTLGSSRNLEGLYYKARPLNGIWATAPYLHNGSVPDLWSLLLPPGDRPEEFWVGSRNFDPQRVGFVSNRGKNRFQTKNRETGRIIEGNSNYGHPWGTQLAEDERWALIEYMKSL